MTVGPPVDDLSAAIVSAQRGDETAFRQLYRSLQPLLFRYLTGLVGREAEDVASETWLQIARDLDTFRGNYDGFRRWAATIARYRAMDHMRRGRVRPSSVPTDYLADVPDSVDTATVAVNEIATRASINLIASLPPDQAEAVLLRVVVGLDARAVGRILGKRPGAVRIAAHRGLLNLAERLSERRRQAPRRAVAASMRR